MTFKLFVIRDYRLDFCNQGLVRQLCTFSEFLDWKNSDFDSYISNLLVHKFQNVQYAFSSLLYSNSIYSRTKPHLFHRTLNRNFFHFSLVDLLDHSSILLFTLECIQLKYSKSALKVDFLVFQLLLLRDYLLVFFHYGLNQKSPTCKTFKVLKKYQNLRPNFSKDWKLLKLLTDLNNRIRLSL